MAEAVISMTLEILRDLLAEEVRFLAGVSGEVKRLQKQLKEMRCLLEDADGKKFESKTVANWISEIRDLAYRAEDAIETYAFDVSSKKGCQLKQLLLRFSCALNECCTVRQIGLEISEVRSEFAEIMKNMQEYGIKSIIHGESSTSTDENQEWKRKTFPIKSEDCFVGMKDDLQRLVFLVSVDKLHPVISVWGMAGIGKTTIARKVYNHSDVKRTFESFAWVCITQQCRIRSVLEDVLKQLSRRHNEDISGLSDIELIEQLSRLQTEKRCLIVFDDLWKIGHWDGLKQAFLVEGSTSKLLLTTRMKDVADIGLAHKLPLLTPEDGLELLQKKAFPQSNIMSDDLANEEKFKTIGNEMVKKCGYMPLAISLLGGILSQKKSMEELEMVNDNTSAYLFSKEDMKNESEIYGVLSLSYDELPYYLKPCFLFMGQYKEDEVISTRELYKLWIALGMIRDERQGNAETLTDIAEVYLGELASRSMVQVEVTDSVAESKYRYCKLHDIVRELCLSKGLKEDFHLQIMDYQGGNFSTLLTKSLEDAKTRHLVINFKSEIVPNENGSTKSMENYGKHVRSLQLNRDLHKKEVELLNTIIDFHKFKLVKILVFKKINFARRQFPRGIDSLIHLRHLWLEECELDEVPLSIGNLTYLITLGFFNTKNVLLPNVLKKFSRLKHLILPHFNIKKIGNHRLALDGLDELETLTNFNSMIHDLKSIYRMKNLRHFRAKVNDNKTLSAIINANKRHWKNLRVCDFIIKECCQFVDEEGLMILKNLFSCPHLRDVRLFTNVGMQLPKCENEICFSSIILLAWSNCMIENDPMEMLGKIPFLEILRFHENSYLGEELKCPASGFPRLKELLFDSVSNLRDMKVKPGAMPCLISIGICSCSRMEVIPEGFRFIRTLQQLEIVKMAELGRRVLASSEFGEGEDYDKVRHVPSIVVYE